MFSQNIDAKTLQRTIRSLIFLKALQMMKEHGVGASTFADWWAYKFEVNDAFLWTYNA
jgi:hypothetical protein